MERAFVLLATTSSPFEAKLLAARLGSEGVVWQLRGEVDGMYPLGTVDVLVDADDLERARDLLAADSGGADDLLADDLPWEVDPDAEDVGAGPRTLPGATRRWVPGLLLALVALAACTRLVQAVAG